MNLIINEINPKLTSNSSLDLQLKKMKNTKKKKKKKPEEERERRDKEREREEKMGLLPRERKERPYYNGRLQTRGRDIDVV